MLSQSVTVNLVVKQFPFNFGTRLVSELTSAYSISDSMFCLSVESVGAASAQIQPNLAHDRIEDAQVSLDIEVAFWRDLGEARKLSLARHLHLVHYEVAIVDRVVAKLCPNIAHFNAWQRLMRFHIPDLHDEGLHAVVIAEGNAPGEDNRMIREQAKRAWPELRRFNCRCMYHKLLSLLIVRGCGFDTCNV